MKQSAWVLALAAAGCAVNQPLTADEFRQKLPGSFMGKVQTFEVNRSVREVAKTFQARAPECLSVRVQTISQTSGSYQNLLAKYTPTVIVNDKRTELHVQRKWERGVISPGKEPEGGHYMLVADATPIDRSRTRIDIYGPSRGSDTMIGAITAWASGKSQGCPDLTKG
jgi:hypothetical protein